MQATPRIKICGITREQDALYAAALGVDAVGFVLARSPRRVTPGRIQEITALLPPFVSTVGVFVDTDADDVREIVRTCRLDWVQLHGDEPPEYCADLGLNVLKAIRVRDAASIEAMAAYRDHVKGFVLDTYVEGQKGGTGQTFDWALARQARAFGPVILAGGLTAQTVTEAINMAEPYGVDVSSGVESAPGIKDHDRMRLFVEAVRNRLGKEG
jgi:phosphoribosylanthranilate isomerase